MDSTLFFTTGEGKLYLYDFFHNEYMLVHPLIEIFFKLDNAGIVEEDWKKEIGRHIPVDKYEPVYEFNFRKYHFLKENSYFLKLPEEKIISSISPDTVAKQLNKVSQIVFEVTDKCNLNCRYCAYGELYANYDERESSFMDFDTAKSVLDYFIGRWNDSPYKNKEQHVFVSFYGGEPLLGGAFIKEVVAYVEDNFPSFVKYTFSMTTNAMLLNKYMDYLVDKNFNVLVSLDGNAENNGHRVTHSGNESFSVIYANLKLFQQKYPDFFQEKVNFNSVLHNLNTVEETFNFIQREFGKITHISELNDNGVRDIKREEFNKTYKNIYKDLSYAPNPEKLEEKMFIELPKVRSMSIFTSYYTNNHVNTYNNLLSKQQYHPTMATGTCMPFSKKIFITVNKKLLACERIGQEYPLGSVTEQGVLIDCEQIAAMYNQFYEKVWGRCNKCYISKTCTKCMYYFEDIRHPVCDEFMNKDNFSRYFAQHVQVLEKTPGLYKRLCNEVIME